MLSELIDFIGSLERQPAKECSVTEAINCLCLWLFCSSAGYLTGQGICIIFGIGIFGACKV